MPPKTKFSKEQIIEAAFEIAAQQGLEEITIRRVAEKLNSSIAPIYVNFNHVGELKEAVIEKINDISRQMVKEQDTGHPFYDIGMASLKFAKEYSVLFRDLAMKPNDYMNDHDETLGEDLVEQMGSDPELQGLDHEERKNILLKMQIFQTGLSVMVANGLFSNGLGDEEMMQLLESTGFDVIAGAHKRKNDGR